MISDWKKAVVNKDISLMEALNALEISANRVLMVVDDEGMLQGVLTDGDIRRGLLKGCNGSDSITLLLNTSPVIASTKVSPSELLHLMREQNVLAVPIVDKGGVCGLATVEELLKRRWYDNPVFLMAGGFGTRLRPLTNSCPKPLLPVGDKPILERVLLNFKRHGFYNFYISTHYLAEKIEEYFGDGSRFDVNIQYVHEDSPLGTGGALGLLPDDISSLPLIMMNGDILTTINIEELLQFHLAEKAEATMCVRTYEYQVPYGVVTANGLNVTGMIEKPLHSYNVNAGIYVLNSSIVKSVKKGECIDMPSLLSKHLANQKKVAMFTFDDYWLDIGRKNDFERAQHDIELLAANDG